MANADNFQRSVPISESITIKEKSQTRMPGSFFLKVCYRNGGYVKCTTRQDTNVSFCLMGSLYFELFYEMIEF